MTDNNDDDDDDLVDIPTKIPKLDNYMTDESETTCAICFDPWTTTGDHKIVSIKCGHVFGQKCIESWLVKTSNKPNCPICKRSMKKKSIRPLFLNVKTVVMQDNSEHTKTVEELTKLKEVLYNVRSECSELRLKNQLITNELQKLQDENKKLLEIKEYSDYQLDKTSTIDNVNVNFQLRHKLLISAIGNCRVIDYSPLDDNICVSCPSSVRIVTGYGVRLVDIHQMKIKKYINLHSSMIRNIEFSRFFSTNLMLSCSLDKYVKITSTNNDSVVGSFLCSNPAWSCTWSNNNNIIYAGLNNGNIEEIDIRNLSSPINTIFTQAGGPIISLRYICGNEYVKDSGLLVTNSTGVIFLHNSLSESQQHLSLVNCKMDTILMSSKYNSSLIHTAFNDKNYHLLNTFRPNEKSKNVRYQFSAIGSIEGESEVMYGSDIKSLYGGTTAQFMSRSCFLTDKTNDSINYAVAANEIECSVKIWDLNNFNSQVLYPKDVSPKKPIIDLCQYSSDPLSFAALNSDNLYFFRHSER